MTHYSVLMSVYYKEDPQHLRDSISSMLNQTIPTNDFVLVCDGPLTKDLDAVIDEFNEGNPGLFQVIRLEENQGLGTALNIGMRYCKNNLIARMDSDDISYPDRCEKQLKIFQRYNVDIVGGTVQEFDGSISNVTTQRVLPENHDDIYEFAKRRNPFNHPAVMYRKDSIISVGGYQDFYLFEDYYLWVRALMNGARGYNINEPILYMRAGSEMYDRRGGIKYLKSMWRFRWYMKKSGFSGWLDFLYSVLGHSLVCLIPNRLRQKIYEVLLRR